MTAELQEVVLVSARQVVMLVRFSRVRVSSCRESHFRTALGHFELRTLTFGKPRAHEIIQEGFPVTSGLPDSSFCPHGGTHSLEKCRWEGFTESRCHPAQASPWCPRACPWWFHQEGSYTDVPQCFTFVALVWPGLGQLGIFAMEPEVICIDGKPGYIYILDSWCEVGFAFSKDNPFSFTYINFNTCWHLLNFHHFRVYFGVAGDGTQALRMLANPLPLSIPSHRTYFQRTSVLEGQMFVNRGIEWAGGFLKKYTVKKKIFFF